MKRGKLLLVALLAAVPVLGFAITANAQSFESGNNVTVPPDKTINSTLYSAGNNIEVAGTIDGDVFCAGQNVTISGTVNGDVICGAQTIHISGTVNGSIRVAAQSVTISGTITDNASIIAQTVTADSRSNIKNDAGIAGATVILNGAIGRDLATSGSSVTLNGAIGRNVQASSQDIALGRSAVVDGNVEYTSQNKLDQAPGAQVKGKVVHHTPEQKQSKKALGFISLFGLYVFLAMLFTALILVLLFPQIFHTAAENTRASMLRTLLVGFLTSIVVPVVLLILAFTVIGIPLAIIGTLVWLIVLALSGPFAAYLLGRLILDGRATNAILTMLLGAVILLVLYLIPFLNFFVLLLALWFGIGMIVLRINYQRPHYKVQPAIASTTYKASPTNVKNVPAKKTTRIKKNT